MGQTLEGTFQKVFVGVSRENWGVSFAWGAKIQFWDGDTKASRVFFLTFH